MATMLDWKPTQDEVDAIVAELRPMITDMARRQQDELAQLQSQPRSAR